MRRALGVCVAAGLLLAAGCSNRLRNNPFDPGNPDTGGRPPGFVGIAGNKSVLLQWDPVVSDHLAGYELFRQGPSDSGFVLIKPLIPAAQTGFFDSSAANDSTYAYRLRFVLTDGSRGTSSDVLARPGPAQIWVADAASGAITRVTPDGRARVFLLPGLETPSFVGVEPVQGRVWSTSRDQGIVAVWSPNGTLVDASGQLAAPAKVAPIPNTNDAWIDDERTGQVHRFNSGAGITATASGFALPSDVVAVPGGAWVVDRDGKRLVHLNSAAGIVDDLPLPDQPWRIASDPGSGDLWIAYTEAGAVESRDNSGALRFRVDGLARPFTIAFDSTRALAWIAEANGNDVVAYDTTGARRARIGVVDPRGVAVDSRTGEVWVTSLNNGAGTLQHFDATGQLLTTLVAFGRPSAVAIDPGP
jgi:DNA-binding beta-propeller fold protein YncE